MLTVVVGIFSLAYSGVVLFALASAFRKLQSSRLAALFAFALSAIVHGASVFLAEPERWLPLTLFWLGPHLLLLPALLYVAARQLPPAAPPRT